MSTSRKMTVALLSAWLLFPASIELMAQSPWTSYRVIPQTVYVKQPITQSRWIEETVLEKQKVTSYKPIWNTEKRERRTTVLKPVQKTSIREERTVVQKPITETKYREKRVEETTYETVTEMREEQYVVRKPIVETQMRDENVTVRRKVTENLIEVQEVTSYRPVVTSQTQLVPSSVPVAETMLVTDPYQRSRLRWLRPGYYVDPVTGLSAYRRAGFHWVQPTVGVQVTGFAPTLVPQEVNQTSYIPEKTQRRRPVEISRYVDSVETRKVPVQIERYVDETRTRRVPITVRKPVTKVSIEKVPYTETRYVDEVVVRKVPVVETEYQEVTTVEPYEVEVSSWKTVTEDIEVPKVVRRRVDYETTQNVARTIMMKVPIDACGVAIGPPTPLYSESSVQPATSWSSGYGTTTTRFEPATIMDSSVKEVRETSRTIVKEPQTRFQGTWEPMEVKSLDETSGRKSILVPESTTKQSGEMDPIDPPADQDLAGVQDIDAIASLRIADESRNLVPKAVMPENEPAESGNETAADPSKSSPAPELNGAE